MPIWTTEAMTGQLRPAFPGISSAWPLIEIAATMSQALREPEKHGDSRWAGQEIEIGGAIAGSGPWLEALTLQLALPRDQNIVWSPILLRCFPFHR